MAFDLSSYLVPINPIGKYDVSDDEEENARAYCKMYNSSDQLVTGMNKLSLRRQTVYQRRNGVVDPPPPYALDRSGRDSNAMATDPLYTVPNDPRRSSYLRNLDLSFIEAETSIWRQSAKLTRSSSTSAGPAGRNERFSLWRPSSPPLTSPLKRTSLSTGSFSTSDSVDSSPSSPPCSPVTPEELSDDTSDPSSGSERRHKKGGRKRKVSFPDYFGLPLTTVRLVEEYVPTPRIRSRKGRARPADYNSRRELIMGFVQPVFDLNEFLHKVDTKFVSLENIRTDGDEFLGTIRVKNIAFKKEVYVRYTINDWASYSDVMTSYVVPHDQKQSNSPYDTFSFRISVDSSTSGVEFAICYCVDGVEYWDNNDGINYHLYCVTKEPTYIDDDDDDDDDYDDAMDYNNNEDDEDDEFFDF